MYFILVNDNTIVDVINVIRYVCENPRNGVVLLCDEEHRQGILSYDGSTIYQLADKPFMNGDYDAVELVETVESEFIRLRGLIDDGENPIIPHEEIGIEEPMSVGEMRAKIKDLEEQLLAAKILLGVE